MTTIPCAAKSWAAASLALLGFLADAGRGASVTDRASVYRAVFRSVDFAAWHELFKKALQHVDAESPR